ncbi:MAG: hypothetical protein ABH848_01520, partial [Candidatus Omnitrophota bacterium]
LMSSLTKEAFENGSTITKSGNKYIIAVKDASGRIVETLDMASQDETHFSKIEFVQRYGKKEFIDVFAPKAVSMELNQEQGMVIFYDKDGNNINEIGKGIFDSVTIVEIEKVRAEADAKNIQDLDREDFSLIVEWVDVDGVTKFNLYNKDNNLDKQFSKKEVQDVYFKLIGDVDTKDMVFDGKEVPEGRVKEEVAIPALEALQDKVTGQGYDTLGSLMDKISSGEIKVEYSDSLDNKTLATYDKTLKTIYIHKGIPQNTPEERALLGLVIAEEVIHIDMTDALKGMPNSGLLNELATKAKIILDILGADNIENFFKSFTSVKGIAKAIKDEWNKIAGFLKGGVVTEKFAEFLQKAYGYDVAPYFKNIAYNANILLINSNIAEGKLFFERENYKSAVSGFKQAMTKIDLLLKSGEIPDALKKNLQTVRSSVGKNLSVSKQNAVTNLMKSANKDFKNGNFKAAKDKLNKALKYINELKGDEFVSPEFKKGILELEETINGNLEIIEEKIIGEEDSGAIYELKGAPSMTEGLAMNIPVVSATVVRPATFTFSEFIQVGTIAAGGFNDVGNEELYGYNSVTLNIGGGTITLPAEKIRMDYNEDIVTIEFLEPTIIGEETFSQGERLVFTRNDTPGSLEEYSINIVGYPEPINFAQYIDPVLGTPYAEPKEVPGSYTYNNAVPVGGTPADTPIIGNVVPGGIDGNIVPTNNIVPVGGTPVVTPIINNVISGGIDGSIVSTPQIGPAATGVLPIIPTVENLGLNDIGLNDINIGGINLNNINTEISSALSNLASFTAPVFTPSSEIDVKKVKSIVNTSTLNELGFTDVTLNDYKITSDSYITFDNREYRIIRFFNPKDNRFSGKELLVDFDTKEVNLYEKVSSDEIAVTHYSPVFGSVTTTSFLENETSLTIKSYDGSTDMVINKSGLLGANVETEFRLTGSGRFDLGILITERLKAGVTRYTILKDIRAQAVGAEGRERGIQIVTKNIGGKEVIAEIKLEDGTLIKLNENAEITLADVLDGKVNLKDLIIELQIAGKTGINIKGYTVRTDKEDNKVIITVGKEDGKGNITISNAKVIDPTTKEVFLVLDDKGKASREALAAPTSARSDMPEFNFTIKDHYALFADLSGVSQFGSDTFTAVIDGKEVTYKDCIIKSDRDGVTIIEFKREETLGIEVFKAGDRIFIKQDMGKIDIVAIAHYNKTEDIEKVVTEQGQLKVNDKLFFMKATGYSPISENAYKRSNISGDEIRKFTNFNNGTSLLDIWRIKEAGFNTIKTYYAPTEEFLKECDKAGLKVLIGIPNFDDRYVPQTDKFDIQNKTYINYLKTIGAEYSHIIIGYLLGNEYNNLFRKHPDYMGETDPDKAVSKWNNIAQAAALEVKRYAPNQIVGTVLGEIGGAVTDKDLISSFDIYGINTYRQGGINDGLNIGKTGNDIKALFVAEGGVDLDTEDETTQENTFRSTYDKAFTNPAYNGMVVGVGHMRDEPWKTAVENNSAGSLGLLDRNGNPKNMYFVVQDALKILDPAPESTPDTETDPELVVKKDLKPPYVPDFNFN